MFEIGNSLREARFRKGLDILECEAETKIRTKYLRAMEEEQFDLLPSPTYTRGFLRTYAEFLELDGQLVVDEYESRFGTFSDAAEDEAARSQPSRTRKPRRRRRSEAQLLWLAIGGVMGVALLVWLGVGNGDNPAPTLPASTTETAPAVRAAEPEPLRDVVPESPGKLKIALVGEGDEGSYLVVRGRNSTGRTVFEGILLPGERLAYRVDRSLWIEVGNTDGLKLRVDGQEQSLEGGAATYLIARGETRRLA